MKDLKDKHSGLYLNKVLLETLREYNIEYNITSITRDNASPNDTLISAFREHYFIASIRFTGDTPCLAHVFNIAVQDILKTLIKDAYNDLDNRNIFNIENEEVVIEEDLNSK
jgi:hypothetical protein